MNGTLALGLLFTYALGAGLVRPILLLLARARLLRPNFRGKYIPVGAGLVLPLSTMPMLVLSIALSPSGFRRALSLAQLVLILGMALIGFLDDSAGNGSARGLLGHFRALMQGELTTGAIKATYGLLLAWLVALLLPERSLLRTSIGTGLIALGANALNLFDLRPGRALKAFFIGYFSLAVAARSGGGSLLLVAPSALAIAPWDLRAQAMLGDTGANVLGGVLGLFASAYLPISTQCLVLLLLFALHAYAERRSLSQLIDASPTLRWLDMLGREP